MPDKRPTLLIVGHGSRSDGWTQLVEAFVRDVRRFPGVTDVFGSVHTAYLEHSQPRIAPTVRVAFDSGAREVFVLPFFLTHSVHASEDVPAVLGLPVPDHVRQRLGAEGHDMLSPGLPIRLLTFDGKIEALVSNVISRVSGEDAPKSTEALVLCGYGSTVYHEVWEELMSELRRSLMERGYGYVGRAYVGHSVANSTEPAEQAIRDASGMAGISTVHVVPLLLSESGLQHGSIAEAVGRVQADLGQRVRYKADSILPDPRLVSRVASLALRAAGVFVTSSTDGLA